MLPLFVTLALASPIIPSGESVAVMPIQGEALPAATAALLSEVLLAETERLTGVSTVGLSDIEAILGLELMKDAIACDDVQCSTEIAGALGVRFMLKVNAGILGGKFVLTGKIVDTQAARVEARATVSAQASEDQYSAAVRELVQQLVKTDAARRRPSPERFLDAGLSYGDFDDFQDSGLGYRAWASVRNEESIWLDILKWVMTFEAVVVGSIALSDPDIGAGAGVPMAILFGSLAGGTWYWDAADVDAVPERL